MEIGGHTNASGAQSEKRIAQHMRLSKARAKAVVKALMKANVDPNMLRPVGYGLTRPLIIREGGCEENQRVEFTVD